jgi:hypothetical protein
MRFQSIGISIVITRIALCHAAPPIVSLPKKESTLHLASSSDSLSNTPHPVVDRWALYKQGR